MTPLADSVEMAYSLCIARVLPAWLVIWWIALVTRYYERQIPPAKPSRPTYRCYCTTASTAPWKFVVYL